MNHPSRRNRPEARRSREDTSTPLSQASGTVEHQAAGFPDPLTREFELYARQFGIERAAEMMGVFAEVVAWVRVSEFGKVELNVAHHGFPANSVAYTIRGVDSWRKAR